MGDKARRRGTRSTVDHSALANLDAASSGHTGFSLTTHAHSAADVTNTPAGGIAATNVQAAINELDTEKAAATHAHAGTDITSGTIDGDRLPAMSTTKKGGVPATGTPTGLFLKDDGTWAAAGGSGDPYILMPWEKPPDTPNAKDDEFTTADTLPGGASAKWTWINQGTSTATITRRKLRLTPQYYATDSNRILYQSAPAGDFTVAAKLRITSPKINYVSGGICLISAAGKMSVWGMSGSAGGMNLSYLQWNSPTSYVGQGVLLSNGQTAPYPVFVGVNQTAELMFRLRVDRTGGNFYYGISADGEYWIEVRTESIAGFLGDVDKIGVVIVHLNTASSVPRLDVSWFRVDWTPDYV